MHSGYTHIGDGCLWYVGINGHDWSSSATSNIWGNAGMGAYYLLFENNTNVYTSRGPNVRWLGFPLR